MTTHRQERTDTVDNKSCRHLNIAIYQCPLAEIQKRLFLFKYNIIYPSFFANRLRIDVCLYVHLHMYTHRQKHRPVNAQILKHPSACRISHYTLIS